MNKTILDKVSKSNGTEIISLLWFILATQITYPPFKTVAIVMGVENLIESIIFAFYFKPTQPSSKGKS